MTKIFTLLRNYHRSNACMHELKEEVLTNLERWSREPRRRCNGTDEGILVISNALGLALDHDLRGVDGVKPKGLNVGLLSHGPLAGPKWVLPAHIVPVVHVECQQHHRHRQLEVPPPQPRQHQVRRRRRPAPLRREHLHQHGPRGPTAVLPRGSVVAGGTGAVMVLAEAWCPECARRHRVRIGEVAAAGGCGGESRGDGFLCVCTCVARVVIWRERESRERWKMKNEYEWGGWWKTIGKREREREREREWGGVKGKIRERGNGDGGWRKKGGEECADCWEGFWILTLRCYCFVHCCFMGKTVFFLVAWGRQVGLPCKYWEFVICCWRCLAGYINYHYITYYIKNIVKMKDNKRE